MTTALIEKPTNIIATTEEHKEFLLRWEEGKYIRPDTGKPNIDAVASDFGITKYRADRWVRVVLMGEGYFEAGAGTKTDEEKENIFNCICRELDSGNLGTVTDTSVKYGISYLTAWNYISKAKEGENPFRENIEPIRCGLEGSREVVSGAKGRGWNYYTINCSEDLATKFNALSQSKKDAIYERINNLIANTNIFAPEKVQKKVVDPASNFKRFIITVRLESKNFRKLRNNCNNKNKFISRSIRGIFKYWDEKGYEY